MGEDEKGKVQGGGRPREDGKGEEIQTAGRVNRGARRKEGG